MYIIKRFIAIVIACITVVSGCCAAVSSSVAENDSVNRAISGFGENFFRQMYGGDNTGTNMIASPLSLYTNVAMLDNGAANNTQREILSMLQIGDTTITQEDLNSYFKQYMSFAADDDTVNMANCVYFSDSSDIDIKPGFVDAAKDSYGAEVFTAPPDSGTIDRINKWASDNTNGAIDNVVSDEEVNPGTVSVLLNAVAFDGKWKVPFEENQIIPDSFTNYNGSVTTADFLCDSLSSFYSDDMAFAFTKPYEGDYSFIGILPFEDVGVDEYIASMDGSTIKNLLANEHSVHADIRIPKFEFDNEFDLKETMKNMGMVEAFDGYDADFSQLATYTEGNIYVDVIKQLTHVKLDENGTNAYGVNINKITSAVFLVEVDIYLDRPFLFVIYDTKNDLPVFIGTVCKMSEDKQPDTDAANDSHDTDDENISSFTNIVFLTGNAKVIKDGTTYTDGKCDQIFCFGDEINDYTFRVESDVTSKPAVTVKGKYDELVENADGSYTIKGWKSKEIFVMVNENKTASSEAESDSDAVSKTSSTESSNIDDNTGEDDGNVSTPIVTEQPNDHKGIITAVIVAAVIVCAVCVFLFVRKKRLPKKQKKEK